MYLVSGDLSSFIFALVLFVVCPRLFSSRKAAIAAANPHKKFIFGPRVKFRVVEFNLVNTNFYLRSRVVEFVKFGWRAEVVVWFHACKLPESCRLVKHYFSESSTFFSLLYVFRVRCFLVSRENGWRASRKISAWVARLILIALRFILFLFEIYTASFKSANVARSLLACGSG